MLANPHWLPDLKCLFNGTSFSPVWGNLSRPRPQESLSLSWVTKEKRRCTSRLDKEMEKFSSC